MTERERETTTFTPADLLTRLEQIEQGQRTILAQLAALAAAVEAGRDDQQFYDEQFTSALGRLSGKLNAILDRLARADRPQGVDDLARAALAAWERDQGRRGNGTGS